MTTASDKTASPAPRTGSYGLGALLCGVFGTISAGAGLLCLGMAGLIWSDWQFWASSSWDDEADLGIAAGIFFLAVWAVMLLVAIVLAVVGARRAEGEERRSLHIMAAVVPLVSVVLLLVVMPIVLGQGGAQLIPLDEVGR
jgi:Kef-type K+ transport system membrane component KefB